MNRKAEADGGEDARSMFGAMYEELVAWRKQHPQVSADDIFAQILHRGDES